MTNRLIAKYYIFHFTPVQGQFEIYLNYFLPEAPRQDPHSQNTQFSSFHFGLGTLQVRHTPMVGRIDIIWRSAMVADNVTIFCARTPSLALKRPMSGTMICQLDL